MDSSGRVSQDEYHGALDRRDRRIAELEARLKEVAHAYDVTFKRRVDLEIALLKALQEIKPHGDLCKEITALLGSAVST